MTNCKTITLLSGGIDSATATALAIKANHKVIGLSFDYGQRHKRELEAASVLAKELGVIEHIIMPINLSAWGGSSLTDTQQSIPTQKTQQGVIPNTYVPGRNTVFIAIGLSLAEARKANHLLLGINAMDYSGYPDCRPDYLQAYQNLANLSSKSSREGNRIKLWAPLLNWKKVEIINEALKLGVPIEKTWSCYNGQDHACGVCDSCRIRDEALQQVGRSDLCRNQ